MTLLSLLSYQTNIITTKIFFSNLIRFSFKDRLLLLNFFFLFHFEIDLNWILQSFLVNCSFFFFCLRISSDWHYHHSIVCWCCCFFNIVIFIWSINMLLFDHISEKKIFNDTIVHHYIWSILLSSLSSKYW